MKAPLQMRLAQIDWSSVETAYGTALAVPDQLASLLSGDDGQAMKAAHDLWCGLCHQHAYISSAALQALPFIVEALEERSDALKVEILDILLGFAVGSEGGAEAGPDAWKGEVRQHLLSHLELFIRLAVHPNEEIADFAGQIVESVTHSPPPKTEP